MIVRQLTDQDVLAGYFDAIIKHVKRHSARNLFRDIDGAKPISPHVTDAHWDLEVSRIDDVLLSWQMRFLPVRTDLSRVAIALPNGRITITLLDNRYTIRTTEILLIEARLRGLLDAD